MHAIEDNFSCVRNCLLIELNEPTNLKLDLGNHAHGPSLRHKLTKQENV